MLKKTTSTKQEAVSGHKQGRQVSISPTFYEQLLRQNPFDKKLQNQIVST